MSRRRDDDEVVTIAKQANRPLTWYEKIIGWFKSLFR